MPISIKKFNRLLFSILALLGLIKNSLAESEVIKIVSSLPRTGSSSIQTNTMVNGIKLALEERNYKAGGFKIVYEDWDDASPERGTWDPAVEAANADRAIKDSDVMVYLGPYNSGAAKISMPKLNQAGLAIVSPAASWPGLTKAGIGEANEPKVYRPSGKINFFRVVPADDLQGSVGANWAKELGVKKVAIAHDGELYGKGIAGIFKKAATKLGIEVLAFEQIDPKASNYKAIAVKFKQLNPDLVYFGGLTQSNAGQLVKDLVAMNVNTKLMFPDGCMETVFLDAAGKENLNGKTYITFAGVPANKLEGKGAEFYTTYKKKYNSEPEVYAVYAYETMNVILSAIEKVGKKDRSAVLQALAETKDYAGALGNWSFDANGDTTLTTLSVNEVVDGKFNFLKLLH